MLPDGPQNEQLRLLAHLAASESDFDGSGMSGKQLELEGSSEYAPAEYLRQLPDLPEVFAGPIVGCRCQSCKVFFRSASLHTNSDFNELGVFQLPKLANSVRRFKDDLQKLTMMRNAKLIIEVGMRYKL
jgi:hypothetical protein